VKIGTPVPKRRSEAVAVALKYEPRRDLENNQQSGFREMRKSLTAVFLALAPVAALTTLAPTAPVQAQQAEVSVSLFYDQLSAHGKWVEHPRWGWVWYPADVDRDWRPYTRGRWVWTQEYGWYWASYEPFGWATYHYGRWGYDEQYGWVWVPGDRWAASWVAFRYSDRAIGWAPLPPDTLQVTGSVTIDEGIVTANYYQPRWVFVEARYFADSQIVRHVAPIDRNVTFIRETRNVTNITVQNNVFVNRSFEPQRIRAVIGREVPTVRVQRVENANRINIQQNQQTQIKTINIYNPQVRVSRDQAPPERARAKQSDRPRVAVKPEFVRPEDRRDRAGPNDRAKPGAPPSSQQDRDRDQQRGPRGEEDKRGATPARPPTTTPGAPPSRGQPDDKRGATPAQPPKAAPGAPPSRGTQDDRRGATPAQPPKTSPGAPPSRGQPDDKSGATPAQPPKAAPGAPPSRGTQEDRRGATPAQPPKASPGAPPSRGTQEDRRGATPATPATPPKVAPGAPPSRGEPDQKRGATPATPSQPPKVAPGAPPSRGQPQGQQQQKKQGTPSSPGKSDDKDKKEQNPNR
jgi:hypothetical protein